MTIQAILKDPWISENVNDKNIPDLRERISEFNAKKKFKVKISFHNKKLYFSLENWSCAQSCCKIHKIKEPIRIKVSSSLIYKTLPQI